MNLFSIMLTGLGLSMDAFAVSTTIGMSCKNKDKVKNALKAAGYFGFFQGFMPLIGYFLSIRFANILGNWDGVIAFSILSFIGVKMIYESVKDGGVGKIRDYSHGAFFALAFATSIDAFAVGVSFALIRVNIVLAVCVFASITAVISFVAVFCGRALSGLVGDKAEILGGIILILMGFKIMLF